MGGNIFNDYMTAGNWHEDLCVHDSTQDGEQRNIKCYLAAGTRLAAIQAQLEHFVLPRYAETQPLTAPLPEADYHWLRQHYLHLSWKNDMGFEYRRDAQGRPIRKIIVG